MLIEWNTTKVESTTTAKKKKKIMYEFVWIGQSPNNLPKQIRIEFFQYVRQCEMRAKIALATDTPGDATIFD